MPIRVVAYYERWSGQLAELLARNASVESTPIIADLPRSEGRPTRQWATWRPQPQAGWTSPSDVPVVAQPETLPAWTPIRQWAGWTPQPRLGWCAPSANGRA